MPGCSMCSAIADLFVCRFLKVSSNEESNIKTMFVSHEKDVGKKTFQKPNILRRKAKVSTARPDKPSVKESLGSKSLVTSTQVERPAAHTAQLLLEPLADDYNKQTITKSVLKLTIANNNVEENHDVKSQETDIDANVNSNAISSNIIQMNNIDKNLEPGSLNIESFINGETSGQSMLLSNINIISSPEPKTTQATSKPKWCFDLSTNPMDIMINDYNTPQLDGLEQKSDYMIDVVPSVPQPSQQLHEVICSSPPNRSVAVDLISNKAVKFKCDEPNCTKGFWSEERLRKHKAAHRRGAARGGGGGGGGAGAAPVECPVRRGGGRCARVFGARRELLAHLESEHAPEDAPHRCASCGRRFFWASGLRAHAHSTCARGGLACAWPGCGRVFRLPCRLREHARAHTGDRPYLCTYPECGWAFRSASKLVRHARRHTGERRHACGACGRAFLRREHLRDHAARHHAPHNRPTHLCPHAGCEQKFTNMSTLYMHMKKVHRKDAAAGGAPATLLAARAAPHAPDNIFLVSVVEALEGGAAGEGSAEGAGAGGGEAEGAGGGGGDAWTHAARTHCTWPLAPRRAHAHHAPPALVDDDAHAESADGGVYSVRSDLFLHASAPLDDDSQNMGVAAIAECGGADAEAEAGAGAHIDSELGLIDSHPTIDLMQEELMYSDAAVDESSFRVLLMHADDLA